MTDWKKRLTAFLHDPPHKPFDIQGHEYSRGPLLRYLRLTEEDIRAWERSSDWLAAAPDRLRDQVRAWPAESITAIARITVQLGFENRIWIVEWLFYRRSHHRPDEVGKGFFTCGGSDIINRH